MTAQTKAWLRDRAESQNGCRLTAQGWMQNEAFAILDYGVSDGECKYQGYCQQIRILQLCERLIARNREDNHRHNALESA